MKVFDLIDKEGRLYAFEVWNFGFGRGKVVRVIKTIPGVKITRNPLRFFSWFREEEFCEFSLGTQHFVAWEPFGDNSRYWIGPKSPAPCIELTTVRDAFAAW